MSSWIKLPKKNGARKTHGGHTGPKSQKHRLNSHTATGRSQEVIIWIPTVQEVKNSKEVHTAMALTAETVTSCPISTVVFRDAQILCLRTQAKGTPKFQHIPRFNLGSKKL